MRATPNFVRSRHGRPDATHNEGVGAEGRDELRRPDVVEEVETTGRVCDDCGPLEESKLDTR